MGARKISPNRAQSAKLHPKPIDDSALLSEIIAQIKDVDRASQDSLVIYNTLPGDERRWVKLFAEIILGVE